MFIPRGSIRSAHRAKNHSADQRQRLIVMVLDKEECEVPATALGAGSREWKDRTRRRI